MMAGLLSAVLIAGMVSGAAPMNTYAEENTVTEAVAGELPADALEESTGEPSREMEKDPTEESSEETEKDSEEESSEETEKDSEEESSEDTTTDSAEEPTGEDEGEEDAEKGDALPEDEITLVEDENALMEENLADDVVLLADHTHDGITYTAWTNSEMLPVAAGNYYLTVNVTLPFQEWWVPRGTVNLCLNGKTITCSGNAMNAAQVINIMEADTIFSLYDCAGAGKIVGPQGGVYNHGTFNLYAGKITSRQGSGVSNTGIFNMYGGEISDCTAYHLGGGVTAAGTFNMYGGKIRNNTLLGSDGWGDTLGGGVFVSGTFNMYGGEISGNIADAGGGVSSGGGRGSDRALITIKGDAIINGNKDKDGNPSNVNLFYNETIAFDHCDPAQNVVSIGVMTDGVPTARMPITIVRASTTDYRAYVHCDNPDYMIIKGEGNSLLLTPYHEHQWSAEWTSADRFHYHKCSAVNCYIFNDEEKEGYGACTEDGGTVTKEPTETEDGIRTYRCLVCEHVVRTEAIPAAGTGGDKPDEGNDNKTNNGGGGERPEDNSKPNDNPPENNNDSGNNSVSDDHSIANNDSGSVDVPRDIIDTDTVDNGDSVLDMDTETPVMIPEQPKDSEPKTADATLVELYATLAMISGLTYVILSFADRNGGMTEETKKELVFKLIRWAKRGKTLRRLLALSAIFVLLVYYHSIGKQGSIEWKEAC